MNMMKWLLASFIACASICAAAQNTPITNAKDVVGCWQRIEFSEQIRKKINEIEPWPAQHQWYCFEADGSLQSLHSNYAQTPNANELRKAFSQLPNEFTWQLLPNSMIKTEGKNGRESLIWAAAFLGKSVIFDEKVIEKGALIMSLYDQTKRRGVYYRYLQRVR